MNRAFTLVELIIVLFVVSILAGVSVVGVQAQLVAGRDAQAKSMAASLTSALNRYYLNNNEYPLASELHGGAFTGLPPSNLSIAATKLGINQSTLTSSYAKFFPCWVNMGSTAPGSACSYGYYYTMADTQYVRYITKDIANDTAERSYIVQSPNGPGTAVQYCEVVFKSNVGSRTAYVLTYFSAEENKVKFIKSNTGGVEMYSPESGQCVFTTP